MGCDQLHNIGIAQASGSSLSRAATHGAEKGVKRGGFRLGSVYRFSSSCFASIGGGEMGIDSEVGTVQVEVGGMDGGTMLEA